MIGEALRAGGLQMSFRIDHRKTGSVAVLDISGKVVLGEAAGLLSGTVAELLTQGERNLLLNLAGVSYLDSAGLGAFMKCHGNAVKSQGCVKLVNVSASIRDLLRITNLHAFFEIYDDEAAAVQSYGPTLAAAASGGEGN
jgi:anti-sigma B factor antagonist